MTHAERSIETFRSELETGIGLLKCQKCGYMGNTLKSLTMALPTIGTDEVGERGGQVAEWLETDETGPILLPRL